MRIRLYCCGEIFETESFKELVSKEDYFYILDENDNEIFRSNSKYYTITVLK